MIEAFLFAVGGILYGCLELLFRGRTHWTMILLGGISFVLVGLLNEHIIPWKMPIWLQANIGACIITILEYITGVIVNINLGWEVWDYTNLPFNLQGQICLYFFLLWHVAAVACILLDDWIRYKVQQNRERPKYYWRWNA